MAGDPPLNAIFIYHATRAPIVAVINSSSVFTWCYDACCCCDCWVRLGKEKVPIGWSSSSSSAAYTSTSWVRPSAALTVAVKPRSDDISDSPLAAASESAQQVPRRGGSEAGQALNDNWNMICDSEIRILRAQQLLNVAASWAFSLGLGVGVSHSLMWDLWVY